MRTDFSARLAAAVLWMVPGLAAGISAAAGPAEKPWSAVISPDNSLATTFLAEGKPAFQLSLGGWGPQWAWIGLQSDRRAAAERLVAPVPFVVNRGKGQVLDVTYQAWSSAPREVCFQYDLRAEKDVPLTMLIASLAVEPARAQGQLVMTHADGKSSSWKLPLGRGLAPPVAKAALELRGLGRVLLTLDPPCDCSCDGDLRIMLAAETFKAGARSVKLTITLPEAVAFLGRQADLKRLTQTIAGPDWFAFRPSDDTGPSVIGMNDWLDAPAGKHGGVRTVGDGFQFEDGAAVKFWGVNLAYGGNCAPEKKTADFTAARMAKYGINGVRLHKFSYPTSEMGIGDPNDATAMDPEGLDRLDYFAQQLKRQGVYFGWSHTYGFHVCPGNRGRLLAYDEIDKNLHRNTYAFINFAEDVQDLMIEMVVKLLGHKNPYTGLTYAEEPALSFVEMQNEDDIFFYTSAGALNACPTYRKRFQERFADWLRARYGSQAEWRAAWQGAVQPGESLAAHNVVPELNPWFFSDAHLPGQKGGARRRLLDTAAFLHDVQDKYYGKFQKAIRAAGYRGPLIGSPWQAPSMLPHYANLRSDYLVGYIDRHNYFGGKLLDSMLAEPGSGYFSSGLQQVADRPFGLSEWIHVYPSLYSAEGPAIIAAYGLGLQGWDASYEFQSQAGPHAFGDRAGAPPWGVWEADVPAQLGQYPALARMIYRGDVKPADVISVRSVSPRELAAGEFSFSDQVFQQGDVKTFGGSVPPEALAAGRVVVRFTAAPQPPLLPDMRKYRRGSAIVAATGQLAWDTAGKGFFTVNTPGTKAVVGFAQGKPIVLGGGLSQVSSGETGTVPFSLKVRMDCPYASIFLTALDRKVTLADAPRALLSAVARNCNSGFSYFAIGDKIIDNGKPPIMLEPVKAAISVSGRPVTAVHVLDHDGRRSGKVLPVENGQFSIDGARDKTLYYELTFGP